MRASSRIRLSDDEFAALLSQGVGAALFAEIKRHPLPSPWAEPPSTFRGIASAELGAVAVEAMLVHLAAERSARRRPSRLLRMASLLRIRHARVFPVCAGFFEDPA